MMKALAAQVRPLMQRHGIKVNSFEEVSSLKLVVTRSSELIQDLAIVPLQQSVCGQELECRRSRGDRASKAGQLVLTDVVPRAHHDA
jgi:hypothetical protein